MKKIIVIILLLVGWHHFYHVSSAPSVGAGMLSGGLPFVNTPDKTTFRINDYSYNPVKAMELDARVLDASHYYFDKMSRISPTDLVLGWRELSNESTINQLDFNITDRSYEWDNPNKVISDAFIKANTKLVHTIPGNDLVKQQLKSIRIGDVIFARGYLVNVKSASGLSWKTASKNNSTSRTGITKKTTQGDLFFIDELEVIDALSRVY